MAENHELMGGKLHVYKRENSAFWQCSAYLNGKNRRKSTKEESLAHAKEFAEDWFLELKGKARAGVLASGPTFKKAAETFLDEYEIITEGQRSPKWVEEYKTKIRVHLIPFFGKMALGEITAGKLQDYRLHRRKTGVERNGKPPARSTMHHEMVMIRQILKCAIRHGWLTHLPDTTQPYKTSGKITHRAWFSPDEYVQLYTATRANIEKAKKAHDGGRWTWVHEQLHDYVLFMANTGLRPDEAKRLEFRDVQIVREPDSKQEILHIEVRGKRGVGYCKSRPQAVHPFRRAKARLRNPKGSTAKALSLPTPTDKLFSSNPRKLFNAVLKELNLKHDRDGQVRTAYSLRHLYVCDRLIEGADPWAIAKNCRTTVDMIEKFYGRHLKHWLDANAINVVKGTIARERRQQKELA